MIIRYGNDSIYIPAVSDIVSPLLTLEDNKAGSLSFSLLPTHPLYNSIAKLNNGIKVIDDSGNVMWKGRAISSDIDFYGLNEVVCEGKLACLNDSLYRPSTYQGTVEGFLSAILTNHNGQVSAGQQILLGTVSDDLDPNDYIYRTWDKHLSSWELVKTRLTDELGGHLVMRYEANGDYLDYLSDADMTTVSSQTVELGENLTDLEQMVDATQIYTACIPIGAEIVNITYAQVEYDPADSSTYPQWKEETYYWLISGEYTLISNQAEFNQSIRDGDEIYTVATRENTGTYVDITSINTQRKAEGLDYVTASAQMVSQYGLIYAPINETTWDDVTEPLNLYNKACNYLDNQSTLLTNEVNITFADLSKLGVNVDDIRLYDKIHIKSAYHGFDDASTYRVLEVTYNLDAPETSSITVGNTSLTLTDKSAMGEQERKDIAEQIVVIKDDVSGKATKVDVEQKYKIVTQEIEKTEESLSSRITSVEGTATSATTLATEVKQTADALTIRADATDTTLGAHGQTIDNINANFTFSTDGLEIGREGSTSTMLLDNDSLEFKVSGNTVAEFNQSALEVRNVETDNEVGYFDMWATRKGAYITNVGNNLNDVWIGG